MGVLGGGRFLMSEVPLQKTWVAAEKLAPNIAQPPDFVVPPLHPPLQPAQQRISEHDVSRLWHYGTYPRPATCFRTSEELV